MQISIEKLIEMITREVVAELLKRGIPIDYNTDVNTSAETMKEKSIELDMSGYKTPVLTENSFFQLDSDITHIIVPAETVITPGAKDIIKQKNLVITYKIKSN